MYTECIMQRVLNVLKRTRLSRVCMICFFPQSNRPHSHSSPTPSPVSKLRPASDTQVGCLRNFVYFVCFLNSYTIRKWQQFRVNNRNFALTGMHIDSVQIKQFSIAKIMTFSLDISANVGLSWRRGAQSGAMEAHRSCGGSPWSLSSSPGSLDAHPGAFHTHLEPWMLTLDLCKFIMEPWRSFLEPWRPNLEPWRLGPWSLILGSWRGWRIILGPYRLEAGALHAHHETSCLTWAHGGLGPKRFNLDPWRFILEPWSLALEPWRLTLGPCMLILGPWRSSWGHGAHLWAGQAHPEVLHAHLQTWMLTLEPFLPTLGLWRLTLDPWRFIF